MAVAQIGWRRGIRSAEFDVRVAAADDGAILFEWFNDAETRANSFDSAEVGWDVHAAWLRERIDDPLTELFIVTSSGQPIGQARFDTSGSTATLSWSIAASMRGRHLGAPVLVAGLNAFRRRHPTTAVVAHAKPANIRSRASLEIAGFDAVEERTDLGRVRYVCQPMVTADDNAPETRTAP